MARHLSLLPRSSDQLSAVMMSSSTPLAWAYSGHSTSQRPLGGVESLNDSCIRSTKRCLRKIIGKAKFTFDELLTAVIEVEAVLNSRPLTYVSTTDWEEPLTPSHLIAGRRIWSLPDHLYHVPEDEEFGSGPELLTKRARHLNRTLDRFWSRWRKEYLVELREAHRQHNGHADQHKIAVDDVVIVHSKDDPRGFWKLGRVKQLTIGRDDKVRGAVVKVSGKGRQATSLHRPIQLLYPLEVPLKNQ